MDFNELKKSKELRHKLDIQFFAAEGEEGDDHETNDDVVNDDKPTPSESKEKALTPEQVNKIVQKRLADERKKWDEERLKEKTEAEKLKKMNENEKAEYRTQQKEQELAAKEAELNRRELMAQAKATLIEKGIPVELADLLNYENADKCNQSIDTLANSFNLSIEKTIDTKLKGGTPIKKFTQPGAKLTKEDIEKMSESEINANWERVSEALSK